MKKFLLAISVALLTLGSASAFKAMMPKSSRIDAEIAPLANVTKPRAQAKAQAAGETQSFDLHYYSDVMENWGALRLNGQAKGNEIWMAIEIPADKVNGFLGDKITKIGVVSGTTSQYINNIIDITLFLSHDLEAEPFYLQDVQLGTEAFQKYEFTLDEPYEFEQDTPVYVGYLFTLSSTQLTTYYLPYDGVPTSDLEGSWVKFKYNGQYVWDTLADYGNLLISATVEGDNLPSNQAQAVGVDVPLSAYTGSTFPMDVEVKNLAANAVENVTVEYAFNNGTPQTATVNLSSPLAFGASDYVRVPVVCDEVGIDVTVSASVIEVNGVANEYTAEATSSILMLAPGTGYARNLYIEEATATGCPNCPLGILALDYVNETYTDGSMITAALHTDFNIADPMKAASVQPVIQTYINGFPTYLVNRTYLMGFYGNAAYNEQIMDMLHDELTSYPALAKIDLELTQSATEGFVEAKTTSEFALESSVGYSVLFTVVEDKVGPYIQYNNLSGSQGFGIWSTGGSQVNWLFNDVARGMYDAFGLAGSLPALVEAGKPYTFEYSVPLDNVVKPENSRVVAALINNQTGVIENATVVKYTEAASVGNLVADNKLVKIQAENGRVNVYGANAVEVYNVSGTRVAYAKGDANIALPTGLYIVRADNTVRKVVVK